MQPLWPLSGRISTYPHVQFCQATSFNRHPTTKFLTVPFRAVENRFNRLLKKGLAIAL